jgi:hypothetical protein
MTLRTPHLLTLAAAVLAFTATPRPAHTEPPTTPAPCALLSPLQIKTVILTPVLDGKPGAPNDDTTDCTWPDAKGETRVYLSLKDPGIAYKSFRDTMLRTGRLVPVAGLGGDAFYIASAGNSAALYVLKGKHLLLITVDGINFTKANNESAEHTLATEILPKL